MRIKNLFLPQIKKDFSPHNSYTTLPTCLLDLIIVSLLCIQGLPTERLESLWFQKKSGNGSE